MGMLIPPEAYAGPKPTSGVAFRVYLQGPTGEKRLVLSEFLDPARNPSDQNGKRAAIELDGSSPASHLILETLPGPAPNRECDIAIWTGVSVLPAEK